MDKAAAAPMVLSDRKTKFGKDQKGLHKRGIHDQGDFWKFPLETTVEKCPIIREIWPFHGYPFCGYPFWSSSRNILELGGSFRKEMGC